MNNLKSMLLCLIMLATMIGLGAQEWAVTTGSTSEDFAKSIATDTAGNSYIAGTFTGTANFGSTQLISYGNYDIFVAKLDADGNWLWAKKAGGTGHDQGYSIAVDSDGNVYITGYFELTALFGIFPLNSVGLHEMFVAKLNTDGTWLWAQRGGGASYDYGQSIVTDENGNCYVTGKFVGTAGFGTTNLTSAGSYDVYVAKLNTNGLWLWAMKAGGTGSDSGEGIAYDGSNYLYITGSFSNTADFGSTVLTSAGDKDIFVSKLDTNGLWNWSTRAGGTSYGYAQCIVTDGNGRIYVTGYFGGVADFTVSLLSSGGDSDTFIAQLDEYGYWVWAVRGGGLYIDSARSITTDSNGYIYVTGYFDYSAHFGSSYLISAGGSDMFVTKLDMNGNWLWARDIGGNSYDAGFGIACDNSGNCYTAGTISVTAYFGLDELFSEGAWDIFAAKLCDPTPKIPQNITISNLGNDVIVDWDAVTLDTWDKPITPDYYFVYYNTDGISEPYQYLTLIPGISTEYVHQHAGFFSSNHFYQVTAVKFYLANRTGLEDYLNANLHQDMIEAEVKQVLQNIGSGL